MLGTQVSEHWLGKCFAIGFDRIHRIHRMNRIWAQDVGTGFGMKLQDGAG